MAKRKAILIGCPQYRRLVRGTYECDEAGRYRLADDGSFVLGRVRCDQLGGRCMQTLCVLHRHNRGGSDSWYPAEILAAPEGSGGPGGVRPRRSGGPNKATHNGQMDVLA